MRPWQHRNKGLHDASYRSEKTHPPLWTTNSWCFIKRIYLKDKRAAPKWDCKKEDILPTPRRLCPPPTPRRYIRGLYNKWVKWLTYFSSLEARPPVSKGIFKNLVSSEASASLSWRCLPSSWVPWNLCSMCTQPICLFYAYVSYSCSQASVILGVIPLSHSYFNQFPQLQSLSEVCEASQSAYFFYGDTTQVSRETIKISKAAFCLRLHVSNLKEFSYVHSYWSGTEIENCGW